MFLFSRTKKREAEKIPASQIYRFLYALFAPLTIAGFDVTLIYPFRITVRNRSPYFSYLCSPTPDTVSISGVVAVDRVAEVVIGICVKAVGKFLSLISLI